MINEVTLCVEAYPNLNKKSEVNMNRNDYTIRQIRKDELYLLEDFLYEAIFMPEGAEPLPREIIFKPEIYIYIKDFGGAHDECLVAECDGRVCGAVWTRIIDAYGHVDNDTPEFAISLLREYRGMGIGTALMTEMLALLAQKGYRQASLSVDKQNYAVGMYLKTGFEIIGENAEDYIMLRKTGK